MKIQSSQYFAPPVFSFDVKPDLKQFWFRIMLHDIFAADMFLKIINFINVINFSGGCYRALFLYAFDCLSTIFSPFQETLNGQKYPIFAVKV